LRKSEAVSIAVVVNRRGFEAVVSFNNVSAADKFQSFLRA